MIPDPADIDEALEALLVADTTLNGLMTNGVSWDVAGHGDTKYVLLSLVSYSAARMFKGIAYMVNTYLVKAVDYNTSAADADAAARRIHQLLMGGTLEAVGYSQMFVELVDRVKITEAGEPDTDERVQHRGGHYEIWMSPAS